MKRPHSKPNALSKFLMGRFLLFPLFICGSCHMYSTTLPFFLQAFFIPSEAGLHIHANTLMEEFLRRIRFCTELRDHISMVLAPPEILKCRELLPCYTKHGIWLESSKLCRLVSKVCTVSSDRWFDAPVTSRPSLTARHLAES